MTKHHFEFISSYMGTIDYMVTDPSGTYRASWRHSLNDYERSILNPHATGIERETESEIGLLRSAACYSDGEIAADTIDAFNAWRMSEYESAMAKMRANPERYGHDLSDHKPPLPVHAGRWTRGNGWTRVERDLIAA